MATAAVRGGAAGGARARAGAGAQPGRAPLVLTALILVAAVANLNLTVANVVLPDIGRAFDAGQTTLDVIALGYSLGLAGSVLYLGAVGDRYGRKLLLVLGILLSVPACLLAAYAPSAGVLVAGRLLGGVSAGMAYPTTLALITALWSGPARTRAIALWSGIGGAVTALGPLLAGLALQRFWWGSAFLLTLPLAVVALLLAVRWVPAHVNETTGRVDHLGGVLSMIFVAAVVVTINFAPVPGAAALALGTGALALAAGTGFVLRQRRARPPLYDLQVARRRIFWVAAVGGIIVFGSLMGAIFVGQQYLQDVLGYSALGSGLAVLPAAVCLVGSRRCRPAWCMPEDPVHLAQRVHLLPAQLPDHAAAMARGDRLLGGGPGLRVPRRRRRAGGHPGVARADQLGTHPPGWHGLRHR